MSTAESAPTEQIESLSTSAEILPKDDLLSVLNGQPADSSYRELLLELQTRWALREGLADAAAGRTIDHEEVKAIVDAWSK